VCGGCTAAAARRGSSRPAEDGASQAAAELSPASHSEKIKSISRRNIENASPGALTGTVRGITMSSRFFETSKVPCSEHGIDTAVG